MSQQEGYCQCNRRVTRAVTEAIRLGGHFCPTCELPFNTEALDATQSENSFDSTDSEKPNYEELRQAARLQRRTTRSSKTTNSDNSPTHVYDSPNSADTDIIPIPYNNNMDLADAFRDLANALGATGKFNAPPFSGKEGENISAFIKKFDRFCDINQKDEQYKTTTFPLYLDGRAFTLYERLDDDVKADYTTLTQYMLNYFAPATLPPLQAFAKLQTLKKESTETVQEFYEKIDEHTKSVEISEQHRLALFLAGLPKFIKDFVVREKPENIALALQLAKQQELIGPDVDEEARETKQLLKTLLTKFETQKPDNTPKPKVFAINDEAPTFLCYFCGGHSHYMMNCPEYLNKHTQQNNMPPTPAYPQLQNSNMQAAKCSYCNFSGHIMSECRKFKRDCQYNVQPQNTQNPCSPPELPPMNPKIITPAQPQSHSDNPIVCQFCNKPGHVMKSCFSYLRQHPGSNSNPSNHNHKPDYITDPRNKSYFTQNQTQNHLRNQNAYLPQQNAQNAIVRNQENIQPPCIATIDLVTPPASGTEKSLHIGQLPSQTEISLKPNLTVTGIANESPIQMSFDKISAVSTIDLAFLKNLKRKAFISTPFGISKMSLDGTQNNILGLARILLKIGDFQTHHSFYILKKSLHALTLGRDFIDDNVVLLDKIANALVLRTNNYHKTPSPVGLSNKKNSSEKPIEAKVTTEMAEQWPSTLTPLHKVKFPKQIIKHRRRANFLEYLVQGEDGNPANAKWTLAHHSIGNSLINKYIKWQDATLQVNVINPGRKPLLPTPSKLLLHQQ